MKIAIIDISKTSHHTYLYSLVKIFKMDEINLYVSNFLKNSIKQQLKEEYNKINKVKEINKVKIIEVYKLIKEVNSSDVELVLINTLQNNWFFYLLIFLFLKKDILLSIHNINAFYKKPKTIKAKIRYLIRRLALNNSKIINVYGKNMEEYLRQLGCDKTITTLPFSHFSEKDLVSDKINSEILKVVIPGGFTSRRRDYQLVYNTFKKLQNEKIILNILGRLTEEDSRELFEKFKKLKNVKTYESFVSEEEFDKVMYDSDIILGPTEQSIEFERGIKEFYGMSKETGFTFAQITYGKVGITPNYIKVMEELKTSTLNYSNSSDLEKKLINFLKNPKILKNLRDMALDNSRKFTSEKQKKIFQEKTKKILIKEVISEKNIRFN